MSLETDLFATLGPLAGNRVYPDVAPVGAALPRIVYQQAGGASVDSLDIGRDGYRNARIQVSVWAQTRAAASALARTVEDTLTASATLAAIPEGAMAADHEPDTNLYGCRQDFSLWYL